MVRHFLIKASFLFSLGSVVFADTKPKFQVRPTFSLGLDEHQCFKSELPAGSMLDLYVEVADGLAFSVGDEEIKKYAEQHYGANVKVFGPDL